MNQPTSWPSVPSVGPPGCGVQVSVERSVNPPSTTARTPTMPSHDQLLRVTPGIIRFARRRRMRNPGGSDRAATDPKSPADLDVPDQAPPRTRARGGSHCGIGDRRPQTARVTVRARRPADLPQCVETLAEVHSQDGYPKRWPADPVAWLDPPTLIAAWIDGCDHTVIGHVALAADVADPLLGLGRASGCPVEQLASVSRLFVLPADRGTGRARALLAAAAIYAVERGLGLVLDVVDDAAAAIALYERLGWKLVHRRAADWTTDDGHHPLLRRYILT